MKKKQNEQTNQTANDAQCVVKAPNLRVAEFIIEGVSPYVQQAFSAEATQMIMEKQMAGSQANKKKGCMDVLLDDARRDAESFAAKYAILKKCKPVVTAMRRAKLIA